MVNSISVLFLWGNMLLEIKDKKRYTVINLRIYKTEEDYENQICYNESYLFPELKTKKDINNYDKNEKFYIILLMLQSSLDLNNKYDIEFDMDKDFRTNKSELLSPLFNSKYFNELDEGIKFLDLIKKVFSAYTIEYEVLLHGYEFKLSMNTYHKYYKYFNMFYTYFYNLYNIEYIKLKNKR